MEGRWKSLRLRFPKDKIAVLEKASSKINFLRYFLPQMPIFLLAYYVRFLYHNDESMIVDELECIIFY